jgi:hypothetical protein
MPRFAIPINWSMYATMYVEADDLDHAIDIANQQDIPDGEYVDGSWEIDDYFAREINAELIEEIEKKAYEATTNFEIDL